MSQVGEVGLSDFDPYSSDFIDNPYPTYARLRSESPVFYDAEWDLTFFTRHADVAGILKDRRFGRDIRGVSGEIDARRYARNYPAHLPDLEPSTSGVRSSTSNLHATPGSGGWSSGPSLDVRPKATGLDSKRLPPRRLTEQSTLERWRRSSKYATPIPLRDDRRPLGHSRGATADAGVVVARHRAGIRSGLYCARRERAAEEAVVALSPTFDNSWSERRSHPGC